MKELFLQLQKNRIINRFFILFSLICLVSCDKTNKKNIIYDNCNVNKKIIIDEYKKGNIISLPFKKNYDNILLYELYKKYKIIDYMLINSETVDSCQIQEIKEIFNKNGISVDSVNKMIDNYDDDFDRLKDIENLKFSDGIFDAPNIYIKEPILKTNIVESFKNLRKKLNLEDDFVFKSRFWIVIDTLGNVVDVELYKKSSKKIDSILREEIIKTKWKPAEMRKEKNLKVFVRKIW